MTAATQVAGRRRPQLEKLEVEYSMAFPCQRLPCFCCAPRVVPTKPLADHRLSKQAGATERASALCASLGVVPQQEVSQHLL